MVWLGGLLAFSTRLTPAEAAHAQFIWSLWLASLALFVLAASACYARRKGRSAAWGLAGLGLFIGFAFLWLMPSRCGYCGWMERARERRCRDCGAPW
jgi:hypothetical protein